MPTDCDALLQKHSLLSSLTAEQVGRLSRLGEVEAFEAGETVVSEGDLGDSLYLILAGQVEVTKGSRTLARLPAGEFFGEMSFLEPLPRSASVVVQETSYLFRLPHTALPVLLNEDAAMLNGVLGRLVLVLSERLRRTNDTLSSVGSLADWLAGSVV